MMRKVLNAVSMVWLVAAGMVVTQAARTPQGIPVDLLITRARVVDTRSGAITPGRVIAIRGDTIVAIGDSAEGSRFRARRVVDVAGRHVIPGLWDMHMHFGGGDTLIHENRVLLPLYLAHGVTAVRDAAGDLSSTVLAWRDSVARGLLDGPMIFTSGPKIEGKNSIWPGDTEVETRAGVDSALDNLQRLHVDFVKLTDNTLTPDLFRYALGEIRRRGMRSSAHIPAGVTVREAVQLGLGSIEHLSYAIRGASEGIPSAPGADNQPPSFDSANALALFRFMAERGTAITPTLNISRTLAWLDSEDHTRDDYLKYIGPGLRATYAWRIERQAGATPDAITRRHANYEFNSSKLPLLQQSGVLILAGTDAGFLNSYDYPGIGLHDELGLLVKAGLTPLQALQAATINGARWLGRASRYGVLAPGSASDLVILDGNPIVDISTTRRIHGVVTRGRYLDRAKLDSMLDGVAREVSRMKGSTLR
jgi:imidazolonepropionase-like amidohydrolase